MAGITDLDRSVFEDLCKGVHDFDQEELLRLHQMAGEVKAILQSVNDRWVRGLSLEAGQDGGNLPHQRKPD